MKIRLQNFFLALSLGLLLSACDPDISGSLGEEPSAGRADFSTFVAVGDSLTAGYADGAVYRHGQENSYPAIMAQQFMQVGGGAFAQPLRPMEATGSFVGIPKDAVRDRLVLVASGNPERPVTPAPIVPAIEETLMPMPGTPYNNFGVPAAKSFHVDLASYGNPAGLMAMPPTANPFYVRMATNPGVSTIVDDAVLRAPTFFVLWVGNNDILLNALDGSPGVDNPTFGTGQTDVTSGATFAGVYPGLLTKLKTATNKGVLVNVPKIDTIPYFTTVPYDAIPLTAGDAAALNGLLATNYNLVLNAAFGGGAIGAPERDRRLISFKEGQNPVLITDETLTDISGISGFPPLLALLAQARQAGPGDLVLLPASSKLGEEDPTGGPAGTGGDLAKWGVTQPLLDTDVLMKEEADVLEETRQAYNTVIRDEADGDADLLFFDVEAFLDDVNDGFSYGSGGVSSAFIQGGAFSLDGIHPTARGYAIIANEMFKVINDGFGAYIPPVDPSDYTTVFYQK